MTGVPLRSIENNIQYQFIRNRLEKLMPWISGSYIPIKKLSEDPPPTHPTKHGFGYYFPTAIRRRNPGEAKDRHFGGL